MKEFWNLFYRLCVQRCSQWMIWWPIQTLAGGVGCGGLRTVCLWSSHHLWLEGSILGWPTSNNWSVYEDKDPAHSLRGEQLERTIAARGFLVRSVEVQWYLHHCVLSLCPSSAPMTSVWVLSEDIILTHGVAHSNTDLFSLSPGPRRAMLLMKPPGEIQPVSLSLRFRCCH